MSTNPSRLASKQELETRIRSERKAVLLVNMHARRAARCYHRAEELFAAKGLHITERYLVRDSGSLEKQIVTALSSRPALFIVASGDGTIAQVVSHLAYTDTVLGYLPLGTTNNFGRSLRIPPDLDGAVDVIANGKVADVDLAQVNGAYFANMVSIGLSVNVAAWASRPLKRVLGRSAYGLCAFGAVLTHQPFEIEITVGNKTHSLQTHQFNVANGRMHSGLPIAADASIDNRTLAAYSLGGQSRSSAIRAMLTQILTTHWPMRSKSLFAGHNLILVTNPPQKIEIDGEVRKAPADGRYRFEVAGEALKVLVPASFKDE